MMSTYGIVSGIREFINGRHSPRWPRVDGVIEESSVQHDDDCTPYPAIRYKYYVDSIPYHCDRIQYEARARTSDVAERLVAKYPIGKSVLVYYRNDDPETAVLEPGISILTGVFVMVFLMSFHAGGWCMLYYGVWPS